MKDIWEHSAWSNLHTNWTLAGWTEDICILLFYQSVILRLSVKNCRTKSSTGQMEMRKLLGKRTDWRGEQWGSVNGRAGINALCERTGEPLKVLASDKRMWDRLCDLWERKYRLFVFNNRDKVVSESYWPLCQHINQSGAFTRVTHSSKAQNRRERGKKKKKMHFHAVMVI